MPISGGSSIAPIDIWKILTTGLTDAGSIGKLCADSIPNVGKLSVVTPSDNLLLSHDAEKSNINIGWVKAKEFLVLVPGKYRATYEAKGSEVHANIHARTYINDVPVGVDNDSLPMTYTPYSDDLDVAQNDKVQLYYSTTTSVKTVYVQNFRLKGDTGGEVGYISA